MVLVTTMMASMRMIENGIRKAFLTITMVVTGHNDGKDDEDD